MVICWGMWGSDMEGIVEGNMGGEREKCVCV